MSSQLRRISWQVCNETCLNRLTHVGFRLYLGKLSGNGTLDYVIKIWQASQNDAWWFSEWFGYSKHRSCRFKMLQDFIMIQPIENAGFAVNVHVSSAIWYVFSEYMQWHAKIESTWIRALIKCLPFSGKHCLINYMHILLTELLLLLPVAPFTNMV